eukprot:CAMPEP_0206502236 /NCGR_PEP_ID=MMETSP0324_2-20121206/53870_1 /ASSEMBLY_ACC=CAM_ASM_000836 /TAXON_ID=2866 /ORGANISM="Crypthecodinium cohnii, Strain Seligo" /LENGTH=44 /DNA_ID= /DNA_START= /DNA_END= /DNA_ORIENTATION=
MSEPNSTSTTAFNSVDFWLRLGMVDMKSRGGGNEGGREDDDDLP